LARRKFSRQRLRNVVIIAPRDESFDIVGRVFSQATGSASRAVVRRSSAVEEEAEELLFLDHLPRSSPASTHLAERE
jgi:hypothetical protein